MWLSTAKLRPPTLKGGGKRSSSSASAHDAADALSILGLKTKAKAKTPKSSDKSLDASPASIPGLKQKTHVAKKCRECNT